MKTEKDDERHERENQNNAGNWWIYKCQEKLGTGKGKLQWQ